jgi:amino acid permease
VISCTLDTGTISFAFAIQQNGIIFGILLSILGGTITYYSAMLIVKVADKTQCNRFEDFALKLYGKKCKTFTSVLNLACLMSFIITYIVYVKSMIPKILLLFWDEKELPIFFVGD